MNTKFSNQNFWTQLTAIFIIAMLLFAAMPVAQAQAAPSLAITPGTATSAIGTGATITINKPIVAVGDLMIANIAQFGSSGNVPATGGWTKVLPSSCSSTGVSRCAIAFYKIVDGTEGSTFTFTLDAATTNSVGAIIPFSGVDTTTPFDTATGTWTGGCFGCAFRT